ncbi:CBS domain-containing protein [Roseovarius rhodophyticola]|uniref:CBS domain-containing protein n=1 Tax=Roseovarius rhodophyticola TaxID=3080827 RepID=A0ABZ2TER8_9RHOB|nr:CBS domain-containing protein [Roseovarius sp. W115]MDV2928415.1 CBS domain-containing protein [Roseovarius sp. W115]
MTIKSILARKSASVPLIGPTAPLEAALVHLEQDEISALIVSGGGERIEGILTAADIARGLHKYGADIVGLSVNRLMTRDVKTCDVSASIADVHKLMSKHQIRHVPVTRNGALCGLINILDVIQGRLDDSETDAKSLRDYVAGRA